jgi:hypothetical protein
MMNLTAEDCSEGNTSKSTSPFRCVMAHGNRGYTNHRISICEVATYNSTSMTSSVHGPLALHRTLSCSLDGVWRGVPVVPDPCSRRDDRTFTNMYCGWGQRILRQRHFFSQEQWSHCSGNEFRFPLETSGYLPELDAQVRVPGKLWVGFVVDRVVLGQASSEYEEWCLLGCYAVWLL